jgi:DNA-binding HxlR family transcriptional regulator
VACALDVFGDRWTLLVIRDLANGKGLFKEFLESPEKIATNILADRLARLVGAGLVDKVPLEETTGREKYCLNKRGESLLPVLGAIADWGLANIKGTEAKLRPKGRTSSG